MFRKTLLLLLSSAALVRAEAPRPNILFILCDDLGYGDTGTFFQNLRATNNDRSEPWHVTPKIDTMASQGLRIPHHYCPAPVCAPSRASLLTGVHQGHATVRNNQFDKDLEDNHTLATVLKQAGYATAAIGKWGLQGSGSTPATWPAYPTKRGFDFYHGYVRHADGHEHYPKEGLYRGAKEIWENNTEISADLDKCYTTDLFTARAKKWITDHHAAHASQPFFMYLAFDTPHAVLELPTMAYPAGGGTTGGLQWTGTSGAMINTAGGTVDSYYHPDYASATWDSDDNPATAEVAWPDVYKRYATSVRRIDDCVGDLLQTLNDLGIGSDTLVIFTTDNGPSIESYLPQAYAANFFNSFGPFDGIKRDCIEGGIRVGAIARWPGVITGGRTTGVACQFHDWMPTFAQLAGVPAPARADGTSLVPTLEDSGVQESPQVYVEYQVSGSSPNYTEWGVNNRNKTRNQMQMVRLGDHVGVRYDIQSHATPFEIYDIVNDPGERTNLAASMPALQQQMKDTVLRLRRPDSSASRPYDNEEVPPVAVLASPGVEWKSYIGPFPWVPELSGLTETASGNAAAPDLSVRPQDDDIGLLFSGYLQVPDHGTYTFHLNADTGAVLRLHEMTLIDADAGYTGGTEKSASVNLRAGRHPFRLYYARATTGSPALSLSWSSASIAKQEIPATAFFRADPSAAGEPVANDDSALTGLDTPAAIDVLDNDFDDGAPSAISIDSFTQGADGSVAQQGNSLVYTPAGGFSGTDTFTYTITDGALTDTATVTVIVNPPAGDGRTAHWSVEEGTGTTTTDQVSFVASDAFGSGVDWSYDTPGTASYRSLSFPGTAAGIVGMNRTAQDTGIDGGGAKTITGWIKTSATFYGMFFDWSVDGSAGRNIRFGLQNGKLRFETSSGYALFDTTLLNDDAWHMVGLIIEAGDKTDEVQFFIDGTIFNPTTSTSYAIDTHATGAEIRLGVGGTSNNLPWSGLVDDVRIYPAALTGPDLIAIRNEMFTTSGPVIWGGAGSEASPEYWNQPGTGTGQNGDPTHWNRADPPSLDGSEDARIDGGGIRKDNGFSISGGSVMTLREGASFRLNPTSASNFTVTDGSRLVIEDGGFLASVSAVTIGGAGSTLEVESGMFTFDAQNNNALGLNGGGRVIVRGGATVESTTFLNSQNANVTEGGTFEIAGGTLSVSGTDANPIRAANGLDGGGYDFTERGGTLHIADFTGSGDVATYLAGKAAGGFFKIRGIQVDGFGESHAEGDEWLALGTNGSEASIVLTGTEPPVGYAAWIAGFDVGADTGFDDDFDKDRVPNGIEFLLGGNPALPNDVALPAALIEAGDLVLSFERADEAIGALDVIVQLCNDLVSWESGEQIPIGATSGPGVTITDNGTTDHVEVRVAASPEDRKFARVKVVEAM